MIILTYLFFTLNIFCKFYGTSQSFPCLSLPFLLPFSFLFFNIPCCIKIDLGRAETVVVHFLNYSFTTIDIHGIFLLHFTTWHVLKRKVQWDCFFCCFFFLILSDIIPKLCFSINRFWVLCLVGNKYSLMADRSFSNTVKAA